MEVLTALRLLIKAADQGIPGLQEFRGSGSDHARNRNRHPRADQQGVEAGQEDDDRLDQPPLQKSPTARH